MVEQCQQLPGALEGGMVRARRRRGVDEFAQKRQQPYRLGDGDGLAPAHAPLQPGAHPLGTQRLFFFGDRGDDDEALPDPGVERRPVDADGLVDHGL